MAFEEDNTDPSLPSPPFYNVSNIYNLRDVALSPLRTPSGDRLRSRLLYRSADVSQLDHEGWKCLRALGITHVFDLRSAAEIVKSPPSAESTSPTPTAACKGGNHGTIDDPREPPWIESMRSAGIQRSWTPVFVGKDYNPERLAQRYVHYMEEDVRGFVMAYRDILQSAGGAFGEIFKYLAGVVGRDMTSTKAEAAQQQQEVRKEEQEKGILIHCSAGKDRTGLFAALLLDLLHFPRPQIADEYHLTELGLSPIRHATIARLITSPPFLAWRAGQPAAQEPRTRSEDEAAALRMIGANRQSMLATLAMVDEEFGGTERYVSEACGVSDEEVAVLRAGLLG